jgi:hypothetical protein
LQNETIKIDGKLDENIWQSKLETYTFTQTQIETGKPSKQPTKIAIAYNNVAIYIAAEMIDSAPDSILAELPFFLILIMIKSMHLDFMFQQPVCN